MLYNYHKSNQGLLLNNEFRVDFKVLDLDHSLQMIDSGHVTEPRYGAGASKKADSDPCKTGVYITPVGHTDHPTLFEGNCLIIAIIYSYFHEQFQIEEDGREGRKYTNMKTKLKGSDLLKKSAGNILYGEFSLFERNMGVRPQGPYALSEFHDILDLHNAQLHIFSLETRTKTSYPVEFSPDRSQWYLEQTEVDGSDIIHVNVIIDLKKFFRRNNFFYCFGCDKSFRYSMN